MVERVKITSSQILLKDSSGNIKFNTDSYYLKTGSGTLYAGGYDRAPAIYGQNSVYDHTDSGQYTAGLFNGATFSPLINWNYYQNVPKSDSIIYKSFGQGGALIQPPFASSVRTLKYFNYDTRVLSDTNITYTWQISAYGYNPDAEGAYTSTQWEVSPVFNTNYLPAITNPNGGTYEISYTANEYGSWSRTRVITDPEYGYQTTVTEYGSQYYTARPSVDEFGNSYTTPGQPIYWRRNGIFSTRNPVSLSLAVTP